MQKEEHYTISKRQTLRAHEFVISPRQSSQIESTIRQLQADIINFDYTQLRSVKVESGGRIFARASDEAAKNLIIIFSQLKTRLSVSINLWPVSEHKNILLLAHALLDFKERVAASERTYYIKNSECALLKDSASWVIRFHYIIEKFLDDIKTITPGEYGCFIRNVKDLNEEVYRWLEVNLPEQIKDFITLQPDTVLRNNKRKYSSTFLEERRRHDARNSSPQEADEQPHTTRNVRKNLFPE